MRRLIAIDFFCGIGGLTKGFARAGIKVVCGIDIDPTVEKTYTKNNRGTKFIRADIGEISAIKLHRKLGIRKKDGRILFAACAPCQPFSLQNKKRNMYCDKRRTLLLEFGRIIDEGKPDYIFVENVPGILKKKGNSVYGRFIKILEKNNYNYAPKIVDFKYYGIPQKRRRFVLLASKKGKIMFPEETHDGHLVPFLTVRDAISKYPPIMAGETHKSIPNHCARRLSDLNLLRLRNIPKDGGSRKSLPDKLVLKCHRKYGGHTDVYGRMRWDTPAPALTCKCTSISNGRFAHPEQDRGISIREAATLQTFADDYVFYGKPEKLMQHVGNAVPVEMARVFGKQYVKDIKNTG